VDLPLAAAHLGYGTAITVKTNKLRIQTEGLVALMELGITGVHDQNDDDDFLLQLAEVRREVKSAKAELLSEMQIIKSR
jgi:hypothetical protein